MIRACAVLAILVLGAPAWPAPKVPVVYRDDYVTVHAGVVDAGRRVARIGDVLRLEIAVQFDPDRTRVADFDDSFFERTFADEASIALVAEGARSTREREDGLEVLSHRWQFQVLGCPDGSANCPGPRLYEMPLALVDYDVLSLTGGAPSQRSARLRPWPGTIMLTSAFPETLPADATLAEWVPGAAKPLPVGPDEKGSFAWFLLAAGALLLLAGSAARQRRRAAAPASRAAPMPRWEKAAASLEEDELANAEWVDRYRRCLVWYLLDVEGVNPFSRSPRALPDTARGLLDDTNALASVDDRREWLDRLHRVTGAPRAKAEVQ